MNPKPGDKLAHLSERNEAPCQGTGMLTCFPVNGPIEAPEGP